MKKAFITLVFCSWALANETAIYHYNLATQKAELLTESPRPNRVYFVQWNESGKWVYSLTNKNGKFSNPLEVLAEGSILNAEKLEGSKKRVNFTLNQDATWTETKAKEKILLFPSPIQEEKKLPPLFTETKNIPEPDF